MGHGRPLVESMPLDRKVVGLNPALATTPGTLKNYVPPLGFEGQVLYLQLPVALQRVNSDAVSIAVVGSASE